MADKRIHELTDEQATYSQGIYLATDDSTFTTTKKVTMGTVYPKASTLSAASGVNTGSWILKLDNGSGAETKITLADFMRLFHNEQYYENVYIDDDRKAGELRFYKFMNIVVGIINITPNDL